MRSSLKFMFSSALLVGLLSCPTLLRAQGTSDNPGTKEQKIEPGSADAKTILNKLQNLSADQRLIIDRLSQVLDTLKEQKIAKNAKNIPEPGKMPEETITRKVDLNAQEQMSDLNKKMDEIIKLNMQVQNNTRDLGVLQRKHDNMQIEMSQVQSDIIKLQQDVGRLRGQMDSLRNPSDIGREDTQRRSSASLPLPLPPDSGTATTPARPLLGTVKLINSYLFPVNVVVDGKLYALGTNETLSLDRLPGYFTYEVAGIQGNTMRSVNAGETLTIRVVPR